VWKKIGMAAIVFGFLGVSAFVTGPVKEEERIGSDQDEESFEPIVVLELFTSQGCSSCPAADALLNQTKQKSLDNVFTLSYHVDYWNYIGWEDPFSSSQYAKRVDLYLNPRGKNAECTWEGMDAGSCVPPTGGSSSGSGFCSLGGPLDV
jgi:hypothetical protein